MDILNEIKIDVVTFYLSNKSNIEKSLYFFMYEVTILNSIHLALIFTGISMLRSWCWRMYFNYKDISNWFGK